MFEGKAELLNTENFKSTRDAVSRLNTREGHVACPEGFCVVFSQRADRYYFVYRRDRQEKVIDLFSLEEWMPPSGWLAARESFFGTLSLERRGFLGEKQLKILFDEGWSKLQFSDESLWTIEHTSYLCEEGEEAKFEGKVGLLRKDEFTSVRDALLRLNSSEGHLACPEGFCVVFSQRRNQYFILYRRDKKALAFWLVGLADSTVEDTLYCVCVCCLILLCSNFATELRVPTVLRGMCQCFEKCRNQT